MPQLRGRPGDPSRAAFAAGGYNIYEPQCFEPPQPAGAIYYTKTKLQTDHPEMVSRAAMIRTRDHKLILRPQGQSELYSYGSDPAELNNLYGSATVASVQHKLLGSDASLAQERRDLIRKSAEGRLQKLKGAS